MRRKSNIEDTIGESPGYLSSQIITAMRVLFQLNR